MRDGRWGVMRCLAYIGVSLLAINAAGAGELGSAYLRGSRVPEPSYQVFPAPPSAHEALPAQGPIVKPVAVVPGYAFEAGVRYWYSTGKLAKELFDDPRFSDQIVSRLTYDGLTAHSFEAFGRINLPSGLFLKGFAGVSGLGNGNLNDEDFPFPGFPYSSTLSDQRGGRLNYAAADLGYRFVANPRAEVLLFGGFGYIGEKVNAHGCSQIAANPFVCVPAINNGVLAITEDAHWGLLRLGVGVDFKIIDRLTLSAEAAWVPYAQIDSRDTHWLRTGTTVGSFSGPIPQNASGGGFQLEALLNYQIWDCFNLGIGGRYWRLDAQSGTADLEQTLIGFPGPTSQPIRFTSERYGMFVQGSYRFGPL
jgi:hypothetical protein